MKYGKCHYSYIIRADAPVLYFSLFPEGPDETRSRQDLVSCLWLDFTSSLGGREKEAEDGRAEWTRTA